MNTLVIFICALVLLTAAGTYLIGRHDGRRKVEEMFEKKINSLNEALVHSNSERFIWSVVSTHIFSKGKVNFTSIVLAQDELEASVAAITRLSQKGGPLTASSITEYAHLDPICLGKLCEISEPHVLALISGKDAENGHI